MGTAEAATAAEYDSTEMPSPDVGPKCKAMIGFCQALTVWIAACAGIMQRLVDQQRDPSVRRLPEHELSTEVRSSIFLLCFVQLTRICNLQCSDSFDMPLLAVLPMTLS